MSAGIYVNIRLLLSQETSPEGIPGRRNGYWFKAPKPIFGERPYMAQFMTLMGSHTGVGWLGGLKKSLVNMCLRLYQWRFPWCVIACAYMQAQMHVCKPNLFLARRRTGPSHQNGALEVWGGGPILGGGCTSGWWAEPHS